VMRHRGPDDQGTFLKNGVALGIRRLAIIDVASGHQPVCNEDGTSWVVFNGEIYNFQSLRQELETRGHVFRTHSDTETIVHAYEEYGNDCVRHLRGMFAFAVWDDRERKLFIARDRTGEKPLYYTVTPKGTFVFGSELKCLLQYPEADRSISVEAVDAYLTLGYVPEPLSIFEGIFKLPAGHALTLHAGRVTVEEYWDFCYEQAEQRMSEHEYLEQLRHLLQESVRLRMIADVPLGAFLSGGVDSSTIVGLMARVQRLPVRTFSIGFEEDKFNELHHARIVARHFGTEHHEVIVTPPMCDIIDELAWHFDEPFADSSAIPTYLVSKLAREYVTVVLSGDGGDELFAGYDRYIVHQRRNGFSKIPRAIRANLLQPLSRSLPTGARGRNFLNNISLDPLDRYLDSLSLFTELNKLSLYSPNFQEELGEESLPKRAAHNYAVRATSGHFLDTLQYLDSKMYLPGDILTKVDRMSMAVSLEARAPFLDHKLIEFVTKIPANLKLCGTTTKHILKRAVQGLVPDAILHRPKHGFGVPIEEWIQAQLGDRMRQMVTSSA